MSLRIIKHVRNHAPGVIEFYLFHFPFLAVLPILVGLAAACVAHVDCDLTASQVSIVGSLRAAVTRQGMIFGPNFACGSAPLHRAVPLLRHRGNCWRQAVYISIPLSWKQRQGYGGYWTLSHRFGRLSSADSRREQ